MRNKIIAVAVVAVVLVGVLLIPIQSTAVSVSRQRVASMDLSAFSSDKPAKSHNLLFIHHSVGGQLLAAPGPEKDLADSIHVSHPNGGGLRAMLEKQGYVVHEASYGSIIGDQTDMFDWLPKFSHQMNRILKTSMNDELLTDGSSNEIVMFKSCYPNSRFEGEGKAPGDPKGPDLTIWNAKATMNALLDIFKQHPDVLFVYFTAPPNAPKADPTPVWKWLARKAMGRPSPADVMAQQARLARKFDNWVKAKDGWLKDYPLKNVVVFDYFDELTDHGASDLSRYPTDHGYDSHPARAGQQKAAAAFVPLLNRAVRRAGLDESAVTEKK